MLVKKVQLTYDGVGLISDNPTLLIKLEAEEANSLIVIKRNGTLAIVILGMSLTKISQFHLNAPKPFPQK